MDGDGRLWDADCPLWRRLVPLYYSSYVLDFLAVEFNFLYSHEFLVLSTYLLGKKEEIYVDENRDAVAHLNDEVLESIEGIRVMRAYSRKERQVRQFQERTESWPRRGIKSPLFKMPLVPLLFSLLGFLLSFFWSVGATS